MEQSTIILVMLVQLSDKLSLILATSAYCKSQSFIYLTVLIVDYH